MLCCVLLYHLTFYVKAPPVQYSAVHPSPSLHYITLHYIVHIFEEK